MAFQLFYASFDILKHQNLSCFRRPILSNMVLTSKSWKKVSPWENITHYRLSQCVRSVTSSSYHIYRKNWTNEIKNTNTERKRKEESILRNQIKFERNRAAQANTVRISYETVNVIHYANVLRVSPVTVATNDDSRHHPYFLTYNIV